jgi:hypothetical protein
MPDAEDASGEIESWDDLTREEAIEAAQRWRQRALAAEGALTRLRDFARRQMTKEGP